MTRIGPALIAIALCFAATAHAKRSAAERAAFQRATPCPSTNAPRGPCAGYEADHIAPLCIGGRDHRANYQWLTTPAHRAKTRHDIRACRAAARAMRHALEHAY